VVLNTEMTLAICSVSDRVPVTDASTLSLASRWFGLAAGPYSGEGVQGGGYSVCGATDKSRAEGKDVVVPTLDQTLRAVEQLHKVVLGHSD